MQSKSFTFKIQKNGDSEKQWGDVQENNTYLGMGRFCLKAYPPLNE